MISLSNLLKQQFCYNIGTEMRVINADERYKQISARESLGETLLLEGITGSSIPTSEEIIDGFLSGLDAEEIHLEQTVTPEELIKKARQEADAILYEARAKAAGIIEDAKQEAEVLYEQKSQQGYQDGVARLQDEIMKQRTVLQDEFEDIKQSLQAEYEEKLDGLETDMVNVMVRVFEKVFHIQFDNKKQILLHLIKDTLLGIDAGKNFVVRVSDGNYKFIESHVADIKEKIGNDVSIDVVNDLNLMENDCIIETATGVYNCGIDMVLSNLEKDILSLCR